MQGRTDDPSVANWIPALDGPLPIDGVLGGSTVVQGAANADTTEAWHVKVTDAAGTNQQAVTAAGDAKVTLDGETITTTPDTTGVKFARINCTATGLTTIVAAVTAKKIRVLAYAFTASAAINVTVQDDSGTPVVLAGAFDISATGGICFVGSRDVPAFETTAGQALNFNLSAIGVNVRGHLTYVEI